MAHKKRVRPVSESSYSVFLASCSNPLLTGWFFFSLFLAAKQRQGVYTLASGHDSRACSKLITFNTYAMLLLDCKLNDCKLNHRDSGCCHDIL
ncbi:hypothetical protein EJ04DRAFT_129067 [Polyplosphaeria fusca]|uniref:Uncharacterized protein n=1 Tax=Polyplosphaeria fusca TaxID=682080 RepID=A0A9P4QMM9_9PLEO|nr:hypothetical protein EJ04DRAFT_129067 [Polyplosphaeria fusca]